MLDYIFFHEQPMGLFEQFLKEKNIPYEKDEEDDLGKVIAIPEDLDDALGEGIDEYYEELLADSEKLLNDEGGGPEKHVAALTVNLTDGRTAYAPIRPELLNAILTAITPQEMGELVDAIVTAVESPNESSICKR